MSFRACRGIWRGWAQRGDSTPPDCHAGSNVRTWQPSVSRLAMTVSALFALTGCAAAAPPPGDGPVEKQSGGIFSAAPGPVLEGLYWYDKVYGSSSGQRAAVTYMFEGLLGYQYNSPDEDHRSTRGPALAESWRQPDPKTFEFSLRKGVKFHDGEDFTSKDVVFTVGRLPEGTGGQVNISKLIEKVEALGPHDVRITLKEVNPDFLTAIGGDGSATMRMIPAHIAERAGNSTGDALKQLYEKNPVGTGPFKFRSFTYNSVFELERHDAYWKGRPYMDGIRSYQRLDRSSQQAAFLAAKVDFLSIPDRAQFETVKSVVPEAKQLTYMLANGNGLEFNLKRKPLDDVRVRRAINLGIDRQAILDIALFGDGFVEAPILQPDQTLGGIGLPPNEYMKLPGWRQPKEQDIAEAKRLLAEAGYPNGFKLDIKVQRGSQQPMVLVEPVANQLKKNLGLDVNVLPLEDALYFASTRVTQDFDAVVSTQAAGASDALSEGPPSKWHSKGSTNYNGFNDPDLDRAMDGLRVEMDPKKRNDLVTQAQRIIIDKAYYVPLHGLAGFNAVQPWVHEFYSSYSANTAPRNMSVTWMDVNRMPAERRTW